MDSAKVKYYADIIHELDQIKFEVRVQGRNNQLASVIAISQQGELVLASNIDVMYANDIVAAFHTNEIGNVISKYKKQIISLL